MRVQFKWIDRYTYGQAFIEQDLIVINYDLLIAEQMIHEETHLKHWLWSEVRVQNYTRKLLQRMTVEQIKATARRAERLRRPP